MTRRPVFLTLVLLVSWTAVAQDDMAVERNAVEESEARGTSDAECGSPRQHYEQGIKR